MRALLLSGAAVALYCSAETGAFSFSGGLSGGSEGPLGALEGAPFAAAFDWDEPLLSEDADDLTALNPQLEDPSAAAEDEGIATADSGLTASAEAPAAALEPQQLQQQNYNMQQQSDSMQGRAADSLRPRRRGSIPLSRASALQSSEPPSHRSIRGALRETTPPSALQLHDSKGLLSGIGSALLGSAAGTLMGGAQQTLNGPFALNTPQTNLTANLGSPSTAAAGAAPAAVVGAPMQVAAGTAMMPGAMVATADPSADTSHNVTGIVIGVIVGLVVLCLIGGCVWKMTKKGRR